MIEIENGTPVRLRLLGGFQLERGGADVALPGGGRRLLALLALGVRPSRGAVAGQLWPEAPERRALGNLRSTLHRLHPLCPGVVQSKSGSLLLDERVTVDAREMAQWADDVLAGELGRTAPTAATELRGDLLPGWYDDWVLRERERLRQLRMQALEKLAERFLTQDLPAEALRVAGEAVDLEPLRESARRLVVRIHLAQGNTVEALRQFEAFRGLLEAELGLSPSPDMIRLLGDLPPVARWSEFIKR
jgi:DNA-binding SARP family transcriptional activator